MTADREAAIRERLDAITAEIADLIPPGEVVMFSRSGYSVQGLEAALADARGALRFVADAAESWHGDDAAKGRALRVIADTARAALSEGEG